MNFHSLNCPNFTAARWVLGQLMKEHGKPVSVESWQGMPTAGRPDMRTHELLNVTLHVPIDAHPQKVAAGIELDWWRQDIKPNLPWADEHFAERVGGIPLNPAPSWKNWPWAKSAAKFHDENEVFDHTYPERFWPKYAEKVPGEGLDWRDRPRHGIRFDYGDLMDIVRLLVCQPHTRQAYLPIYFPEDNSPKAKRKPCTLGYQFIMRDNRLHMFYPMRSCDFVRHWADDAYLAVRLLLWIIEKCRAADPTPMLKQREGFGSWHNVDPGTLTMHMTSLHVFENDLRTL